MSDPTLALEVRGMHKRFGSHEVLKGIDLAAHTGNVISIIGSSGSGKSTFLRCINLLETPDAGDVFLHGELIRMKALRDGSRRALAMEPEVMLFDEPTSALDPELCGEVLQVMRGLAEEGRTMLVVTHEMGFARDVSSHVMFLHDGSVEAFGPAKAVFDNPSSQRMRQFIGHEQ